MNRYLPTEPGSTASAIERGFADHSADRLRAGTFTFSDRIRLIDSAEKLGIPRFRANMILALEQHRINPPRPPAFRATGQSRSFKPHLLAVLVAEVVMVAALVWVCKL